MLAYTPAKTSSNITPQPPLIFSNCRIPSGFAISKKRKKTKLKTRFSVEKGNPKMAIQTPIISSITTCFGSSPHSAWSASTALTPIQVKITINKDKKRVDTEGSAFLKKKSGKMATIAPHVPGAMGSQPAPNPLTMNLYKFFIFFFKFFVIIKPEVCDEVFTHHVAQSVF